MSKLQALSDLLRDETKWPDTFIWDFGDFETCAIGLACRAGLVERSVRPINVEASDLGVTETVYWQLFVAPGYRVSSPAQIADRIDAYLAGHTP